MSEKSRPVWRRFGPALPLIVFVSLAALFWYGLHSGDPSKLPSALVGKEVPDFTLPPVDGLLDNGAPVEGFASADLRTGQPTLVNVFASWCVPCRQEHELLVRLAADPELARAGVRLFGLAYKDDPANITRFLAAGGDPFTRVGADRNGRTAIDFGVYGVPETFVIKGDGKIAYRFVGPLSEESYRTVILPAIEKARR